MDALDHGNMLNSLDSDAGSGTVGRCNYMLVMIKVFEQTFFFSVQSDMGGKGWILCQAFIAVLGPHWENSPLSLSSCLLSGEMQNTRVVPKN